MSASLKKITPAKPYEVVPLGEVVDFNPRFGKDELADDALASFIPMKCVEEESGRFAPLGDRKVAEVKKGYTPFRDGDVLFAKVTPCMENGKGAVMKGLTNGIGFGSTEFFALRPSDRLDADYLFHFILQSNFRQQAARNMTGAVGLRRVPKSYLEQQPIPLPSLPEQRRIVAEIEKQFTRLEVGVAALHRVQANLKRYRAAVLKAACEGRLVPTKNKGWKTGSLREVLVGIEAGKSFKCEERPPTLSEVGVVKVSAVTWGFYNESESKTCHDQSRIEDRYLVKPGDFLFSRANTIELVGACVIAKTVSLRVMLSDKILRFTFSPDVNPSWILYWLRSDFGRSEIERLATGNQESMRNIGQERIRQIEIRLPPITEQNLIVEEVERRLSVVEELEAVVSANLQRATRLRQSILQKAFAGQLVKGSH